MFDSPYPFHKANVQLLVASKYLIATHNYTFKANNTPYIVEVEHYTGDIFVIKFFRKQDRKSKNRFGVLTYENRCTRIVATCISILISILDKTPNASFGFVGSNTVTKEKVESKIQTQRFRIYKRAMENLIGDRLFVHSMDIVHSAYLMVNRKNPDIDDFISMSRDMFDDIFPELSD